MVKDTFGQIPWDYAKKQDSGKLAEKLELLNCYDPLKMTMKIMRRVIVKAEKS